MKVSKKKVNEFYQKCKAIIQDLGGIEVSEEIGSGYCLHLNTTAGVLVISPSRNESTEILHLHCQWDNKSKAAQKGFLPFDNPNAKWNQYGEAQHLYDVLDGLALVALKYKGAEYTSSLFLPKGVETKIVVI